MRRPSVAASRIPGAAFIVFTAASIVLIINGSILGPSPERSLAASPSTTLGFARSEAASPEAHLNHPTSSCSRGHKSGAISHQHIGLAGGGETGGKSEVESAGLRSVITDQTLNFIFVGGKGGVGKTTVSSSLAIQRAKYCASKGSGDTLLISTDPAHSLSDAFRMNFSGEPTKVPGVPGLWVMEIDPSKMIAKEVEAWAELAKQAGLDEFMGEFNKFQSWLTALPGIDEATALAASLERIKSKQFGTIVFDTAPTGHTVKLLGLPEVLQVGIDKLDTISGKIMGYVNTFKNMFNPPAEGAPNVQQMLSDKLKKYKNSVQVLGAMLKDNTRTNFVIVCIAEYLSIMESKRLVGELKSHGIANSHIVVNQLIKGAPSSDQITEVKSVLGSLSEDTRRRVESCMELMGAREAIQTKYLKELRSIDEMNGITIVPLPLLPKEVTGVSNLDGFSSLLLDGCEAKSSV